MYRVIKRDNSIVDFNLTKIKDAMSLAFQSRQKPCHPDVLDLLALKVTADFSSKVKDELVNVEDIQDSVCLLYTSPSPRDRQKSRMPSSA